MLAAHKNNRPELLPVVKNSWRQKCFHLFSIALHNRDSPTDIIPRPGNRTLRHLCGTSAASPFRTRCLAYVVRTLVGRASIFHMKLMLLYASRRVCQEEILFFALFCDFFEHMFVFMFWWSAVPIFWQKSPSIRPPRSKNDSRYAAPTLPSYALQP